MIEALLLGQTRRWSNQHRARMQQAQPQPAVEHRAITETQRQTLLHMHSDRLVIGAQGLAPAPDVLFQQTGLQALTLAPGQAFFDAQRFDEQAGIAQLLPALTADGAVSPGTPKPAQLADWPEPATQLRGIAGIEEIAGGLPVVIAEQGP